MSINKVSFGQVIAAFGKPKKMERLNALIASSSKSDKVMIKDVTSSYKYSFTDGLMGQAAQRGERVSLYITGDDIKKVKNRDKHWKTMEGIRSNLQGYCNLATMSVRDAVEKITQN